MLRAIIYAKESLNEEKEKEAKKVEKAKNAKKVKESNELAQNGIQQLETEEVKGEVVNSSDTNVATSIIEDENAVTDDSNNNSDNLISIVPDEKSFVPNTNGENTPITSVVDDNDGDKIVDFQSWDAIKGKKI